MKLWESFHKFDFCIGLSISGFPQSSFTFPILTSESETHLIIGVYHSLAGWALPFLLDIYDIVVECLTDGFSVSLK